MMVIDLGDFTLRQPRADDLPALYALTESAEMREFLGPTPPSHADSFARLLRNAGCWSLYGYGTFMVEHRPSGALAANCGLFHSWRGHGPDFDDQIEAGWIIARPFWGQGLASRVMGAVHDWFDAAHGPRRTVCMIEQGHGASDRVARRLGYAPYRTVAAPDGGRPLLLYERIPAAMADKPAT